MAEKQIDAIGFEVGVDGTAGNAAPFGGVRGAIGISLVWFMELGPSIPPGPHIYLFTRYGKNAVKSIGDTPDPATVFEGCVFAAHFGGDPPVTPDDWLTTMETIGVDAGDSGGGLLSGEVLLYLGGSQGFSWNTGDNWYAFVTESDIRGERTTGGSVSIAVRTHGLASRTDRIAEDGIEWFLDTARTLVLAARSPWAR